MTKDEIILALTVQHEQFIAYIEGLSNDELEFKKQGKWSAAQQVVHIYKSIRPLALGLQLPKFIVKMIWGKANRVSKPYTALVQKYIHQLEEGGKASSPYIPPEIAAADLPKWNRKIKKAIQQLNKNMEKYTIADLDIYVLPHPLLGKLTLKEMLYFTIYHVQHHKEIIKRDLAGFKG